MGKFKESFSSVYYNSKDDFFTAVKNGSSQPTYVGLLEIVRVLKLISRDRKKSKAEMPTPIQPRRFDSQLCFDGEDFQPAAGAS